MTATATSIDLSAYGMLRLGVASPELRVADVDFNLEQIYQLSRQASLQQCRFLLFPELCLTGYTCGDLFFQHALQTKVEQALVDLARFSASEEMTLVVGAPLERVTKWDANPQYTYDAEDSTPTLQDLEGYETVLVWNQLPYSDKVALGDVLADYSDLGGGVTLMVGSWNSQWRLEGRFMTEAYGSIPFGAYSPYSSGYLGTVHNPTHPIMGGVTSFSTGNFRCGYTGPLTTGSELIASYNDGMVLAAVKQHSASRTCDLGFWPPSSDIAPSSWDVNTDGDVFMFNCLMWTAGATSK